MAKLSQVDIAAGANIYIAKVADALSSLAGYGIIEWDSSKELVKPLSSTEWTKKHSQPKEVGTREQEIFDYWNEMDIMKHTDIGRHHPHIKASLSRYSVSDLKKAIKNYAIILKSDKYFWTHRWQLGEFLVRGLGKFLDIAKPFENWLVSKKKEKPEEKSIYPEL